jgi:electron transfer flavoprotein beta subunit
MKARKKPLEEIPVTDLGVDVSPKITIKTMSPPPERQAGRMVETVDELIEVLQNEAKVL